MITARVRPVTFLRPAIAGFLTLIVLGAVPTPASAQIGVRRWLEKLSGPGPFTPAVVYIAPFCYGAKAPAPEAMGFGQGLPTDKGHFVPATRPLWDGDNQQTLDGKPTPKPPAGFFPAWECANAYSNLPNVYFYYEFGWDNGAKSNLRYAPDGESTPDPAVGLQSHIVGVTFSKWAPIEIGAGVGGFRFNPDFGDRDPFWKAALQPLRINVRPLAFFGKKQASNPAQALMFTLQSFVVLGTLTDADFGALPGTYRESNEVVWTTAVTIDLFRLFPKKQKPD